MDLVKRDTKLGSLRAMQKKLEQQQEHFQTGGGIKDQLNTAVNNIIEHLTIQGKLDPDNMARIKTATEHINKTIQ
jgi:hypothetical protein